MHACRLVGLIVEVVSLPVVFFSFVRDFRRSYYEHTNSYPLDIPPEHVGEIAGRRRLTLLP